MLLAIGIDVDDGAFKPAWHERIAVDDDAVVETMMSMLLLSL